MDHGVKNPSNERQKSLYRNVSLLKILCDKNSSCPKFPCWNYMWLNILDSSCRKFLVPKNLPADLKSARVKMCTRRNVMEHLRCQNIPLPKCSCAKKSTCQKVPVPKKSSCRNVPVLKVHLPERPHGQTVHMPKCSRDESSVPIWLFPKCPVPKWSIGIYKGPPDHCGMLCWLDAIHLKKKKNVVNMKRHVASTSSYSKIFCNFYL